MKKVLFVMALLASFLLALQGATLTSTALNNLATRLLLRDWQVVGISSALFECRTHESAPVAADAVNASLRLNHLNERALLNAGRVAWLRGDCTDASRAWEQAAALAPVDAVAALQVANGQWSRGELAAAMAFYTRVRAAGLFTRVGEQIEATGARREAVRWYEISVSIVPARKSVQLLASIYLNVTNEPDKAVALWGTLQQVTTARDADYWLAAGQAAAIRQDYDAALHAYQSGLCCAHNSYDLYVFNSQAAFSAERLQDFSLAESYYRAALKAEPGRIEGYLRLGELELNQDRDESALTWFERARSLDPVSELPDYYQGMVFWQRGAKARAAGLFEKAYQRNPKNPLPRYYLALLTHEQGDVSRAIAYLEEAIANYPGVLVAWLSTLAGWYAETGRCSEAAAAYERVRAWAPTSRAAQTQLDELKKTCPYP